MRTHSAKLCALDAYVNGLLSAPASATLERHLARCAVCSEALVSARAYAQLRDDAQREAVSVPSWERLEAALDSPAQAQPRARRSGKLVALAWPILAVAAALAIAWLGRTPAALDETARVESRAPAPAEQPAQIVGWISLLVGNATLERAATKLPVTLDSEVREGDLLRTESGAQLHVQLGAETGFALASESALHVARLRQGETELALATGRVTSQVHKLSAAEQYRVRVDDLTASVRGTHFWVERLKQPTVFVHEGRVAILRGDHLLAELRPGQRYPQAPSATLTKQQPVHLAPAAEQARAGLVLPPLPPMRALLIDSPLARSARFDGSALSSAGNLAMRLPRGPTKLTFEDLRGQLRTIQVDLNAPLIQLAPADLSELLAPKPAPSGYLSPEQISKVVRGGIEPLRRCYERNLRFEPALEGKLTARIRVSAEGRVARAELSAQSKLPLALERCMELELQKLTFPKPEGGGALSFEVPLNLKSSR